ncbi:MAG TPA: DUF2277 domain-containing protein [Thermomicrobiales bacterium]|nr:DUF2277 domain-containing protein [Thermomicrobiales bacterium]HRA47213.1 DUF2277 domain-containing protein [Thermomicrobiales bacterium]
MCRNIRPLYNFEPPATDTEITAASLQFVRKVTGMTKPSAANTEAMATAVAEITAICRNLFADLETTAAPKNREIEAAKRIARSADRFAAR